MPRGLTLLFVYGTLKRGDVRAYLLNDQQYLGQAKTEAHYRLFNVGEYPALVEAEPLGLAGQSIHGELYAVDGVCLPRLDEEEGVDEGLYERRRIKLLGSPTDVMTYLYRPSVDGLLDCGNNWPGAY